jgi:hypothetical protein
VEVPVNTTAEVRIPTGARERVTESGWSIAASKCVRFLGVEGGAPVFSVGSGRYHFAAPFPG